MLPLLLVLLSVIAISGCYSKKTENSKNVTSMSMDKPLDGSSSMSFIIPVNGPEVFFSIQSPKGFRSLQPLSVMQGPQSMIEFIPAQEADPYAWSRIITVIRYMGFGVQAPDLQFQLKGAILSAQDAEILEQDIVQENGYKTAKFMAVYKENERKELIYAEHYSGPLDACSFQYTVALINGVTQEQAIKEIQNFMQSNVKLVDVDKNPDLKALSNALNTSDKKANK